MRYEFREAAEDLIGYKKVDIYSERGGYFYGSAILQLKIPKRQLIGGAIPYGWDQKRVNWVAKNMPPMSKYRTSRVFVVAAYDKLGKKLKLKPKQTLRSQHDYKFTYQVGQWRNALLSPKQIVCGSGIHFYRTFAEAVKH